MCARSSPVCVCVRVPPSPQSEAVEVTVGSRVSVGEDEDEGTLMAPVTVTQWPLRLVAPAKLLEPAFT